MKQDEKNPGELLSALADDIHNLKQNETDNLIQIGAQLEQIIAIVPDELPSVTTLLNLSLEGLQKIYENDVLNFENVTQVMAEAVSTVVDLLEAENDTQIELELKKAWQKLWDSLGMNPKPDVPAPVVQAKASATEPTSIHPLNDVAVQLVQLDASDSEGLRVVKESLEKLEFDTQTSSVQNLVSQAARALNGLIENKNSQPNQIYNEVSQLIESALEILAESDEEVIPLPPSPLAEPPQQSTTGNTRFIQLPPDADLSLLGEFLTESNEYIEKAETALLELEINPQNSESINVVFRAFHTIKGTSAFLELNALTEYAHKAESFFSRIRDGEIHCAGKYADLSLQAIDMLKELIQIVELAINGQETGKPGEFDKLMNSLTEPEVVEFSSDTSKTSDTVITAPVETLNTDIDQTKAEIPAQSNSSVPDAVRELNPAAVTDTLTQQPKNGAIKIVKRSANSIVRIRTERLDRLINMVGELVIAQSMVAQDKKMNRNDNHELLKKVTYTGKIIRELQDLTMLMRMVPLKPTFNKMARLVRDLARKSRKQVEFITNGEDVEIDRNMVDVINDPLVHILRNAVDHGLESGEARLKNGKPEKGTVRLAASYSGGNVVVEIQDDGQGLNSNKIMQKAISRGLIEANASLTGDEIFNLIFEPGFSTVQQITNISGRGVGLDVVKKGVEALRGRIDINSAPGKGTTFTLRLPLTLAITDGMLVKVGDRRYIIPTININMSFRPQKNSLSTIANRHEMVSFRNQLLPVFRLHKLFGISKAVEDPTEGLLIVVDDGKNGCALLVDELLSQHQVVAKSLGEAIGKVKGVTGGAILGDGQVGLILDTAEIAALSRQ